MTVMQKLVRDRIPALIQAEGRRAEVRVLGDDAFLAALIAKLDEERREFEAAPGLDELADIVEVCLALADVIGTREELERVREAKFAARGGFSTRAWLESVD